MDCPEVRELLHAYADDELNIADARRLEGHLQSCPACAAALDAARAAKAAVADPALYHRAPDALRQRVLTTIRAEQPAARPWRIASRAIGLAACVALAVAVLWAVIRGPGGFDARDVVACHVRSLQADHLLDVLSTDQHTVKPWFDGRLDFAPPVRDLDAAGFTLQGGRLDYLHDRPVASLVYRHARHVINLFIWPGDTTDATFVRQGYNLVRFPDSGMICWAVSDLSPDELQHFIRLFHDHR